MTDVDYRAIRNRVVGGLSFREYIKPAWLEVEHVDEREDARTAWIVVSLDCNGRLLAGTSPKVKKVKRRHGIHRAALATLRAIELLTHHELSCELVDVACVTAQGRQSIVARVRVVADGAATDLFGSALVNDDFAEASARAVLDAANVYLHSLLVDV